MKNTTSDKKSVPDSITFRDFFKLVIWSIKLNFSIAPFDFCAWIVFEVLGHQQTLIFSFIMASAIDKLIHLSLTPGTQISDMFPTLAVFAGYTILSGLVNNLWGYFQYSIRTKSRSVIQRQFYGHMNYLGVQTIELPEVSNMINRGENNIWNLFNFTSQIVRILGNIGTVITAGITILSFLPIFVPIYLIWVAVKFLPQRYFIKQNWTKSYELTEETRKSWWDLSDLKSAKTMPELQITGAGSYLDKKYRQYTAIWEKTFLTLSRRENFVTTIISIFDAAFSVISYGIIFMGALAQQTTVGQVTLQIRALDIFTDSLSTFFTTLAGIYEAAIQLNDIRVFFEMKPAFKDGTVELSRLIEPPAIHFHKVSFTYPNSEKYIFKDLSLEIKNGEKIAIVGHNGAGKTTLVKLLARLYAPKEGSIFINSTNLNDLKINDWYKNIGILFQEYNTYGQLTAEENIYLGRPLKELDKDRIKEAAENADALKFISEYPKQFDQILSQDFENGVRPSTGQWQKIAIARFFYRNAPLVIFDEPTAAIDAVSEYNIFNRIYSFFENKTVIIISHRFSTVRNADRILVMDEGKIIEEGSHTELMEMNGKYAHAFKLQAEGYTK